MKSSHRLLIALAIVSCHAHATSAPAHSPIDNESAAQRVAGGYELPIEFNAGCASGTNGRAFGARGSGYRIGLAPDRVEIALLRRDARQEGARSRSGPSIDVVRLRFVGASGRAVAEALDPRPGTSNFLRGGPDGAACADVANYGRIRYAEIYAGIDVVYYGKGRELEFDLVVTAGGSPDRIRLAIDGADGLRIDPEGDLAIDVGGDTLTLRRPIAYQEFAGERRPVATSYALEDRTEVSLRVADYDDRRALVIDPVLSYATYIGGTKSEYATGITVDGAGNTYVTGFTTSADFPMLSAVDRTLGAGDVDVFVAKINAAGKALVYSTFLGGSTGIDRGVGIAIDAAGNAYVTGTTAGNFPTTAGAYQTSASGNDSFVAKLAPSGSALVYATYVQGVEAAGIAVDASGSAYVTGKARSTFATTPDAYQQSPGGAFVLKLNPAGTGASYATYLGHGGVERATGIAVDVQGNAYVVGSTDSPSFPVVNALQSTRGGALDGFVAKLNPSGSALLYSTYLGGALDDAINAVAVDGRGNAYVAGETYSADFPVINALLPQKPGARLTNAALGSGFLAKIDANGNGLVYSSFLGGEICAAACTVATSAAQYPGDAAHAIAVDAQGHAYVAGLARSYTFPLANSLKPAKAQDNQDSSFVAKVGRTGGTLLYSTLIRTGPVESGATTLRYPAGSATGVATDANGAAYVTGDVDVASGFRATTGALQTVNGGGQGAILVKLAGAAGTLTLTSSTSAIAGPQPVVLTATVSGVTLSGNVLFTAGPAVLGSAPLKGATATLTTTLPVGIHRLSAAFLGTGKELDSAVLTVVVDNALACY